MMPKCFYLVSSSKSTDEEIQKKKKEVVLFSKLNKNMDVELVFFEDIIPIATDEFNGKILLRDGEIDCPDYVFVRAFDLGDRSYHLKAVLEMFESLGVECINSAQTKAMTSDKLLTLQIARRVCDTIKLPKTILVTPDSNAERIGEIIGFPLVIKIMHGSKGKGVSLIKSQKELDNLLNMVFAAPFNDQIIAQEAILSSKGRDLRVVIALDNVIYAYERKNDNDFKSNISTGGEKSEVKVPDELIKDSLNLAKALNLKLGSIDFLFGENFDEFYLCEANSSIGMSPLIDAYKNGDKETLSKFSNLIDN